MMTRIPPERGHGPAHQQEMGLLVSFWRRCKRKVEAQCRFCLGYLYPKQFIRLDVQARTVTTHHAFFIALKKYLTWNRNIRQSRSKAVGLHLRILIQHKKWRGVSLQPVKNNQIRLKSPETSP